MEADISLAELARVQHGVFTFEQARDLEVSERQLRWRVDAGVLTRVSRGVYRHLAFPDDWRATLLGAVYTGGARAVASHRSAAALWDLPGGTREAIEITCPRWGRVLPAGFRVHELEPVDVADLTVVDAIPVTSPELTLLHLASFLFASAVELAYERARHRGLVTHASCLDLLIRYSKQGRNGLTVLREVLDRRDPASRPTESAMETLVLQFARRHGLPAPVTQHELHRPDGSLIGRLDAAWPWAKVGLEYQSLRHHTTEFEKARDRARVHEGRSLGWEILEVGPDDLTRRRRVLHEAILAALARQRTA